MESIINGGGGGFGERHIIGIKSRLSMSMAGGFKLLARIFTILDNADWFNVQSGASPLWN